MSSVAGRQEEGRIMRRAYVLILPLLLSCGVAFADTLFLTDGTAIQGELVGVDAFKVRFVPEAGGERAVPLSRVRSVEIDWEGDPEPRVSYEEWVSAMAEARLKLTGCRRAKQGTVVGGLLFIAGGYWLAGQGQEAFGNLVMGLGAVVTLLGVASPQPACAEPLHRVEILTRIGLDHGWIY